MLDSNCLQIGDLGLTTFVGSLNQNNPVKNGINRAIAELGFMSPNSINLSAGVGTVR